MTWGNCRRACLRAADHQQPFGTPGLSYAAPLGLKALNCFTARRLASLLTVAAARLLFAIPVGMAR
jgi:hypothetical protein